MGYFTIGAFSQIGALTGPHTRWSRRGYIIHQSGDKPKTALSQVGDLTGPHTRWSRRGYITHQPGNKT